MATSRSVLPKGWPFASARSSAAALRAGRVSAVALLEAFSSFWANAYKEAIVFSAIIPVLVWRSLASGHVEEEEE